MTGLGGVNHPGLLSWWGGGASLLCYRRRPPNLRYCRTLAGAFRYLSKNVRIAP